MRSYDELLSCFSFGLALKSAASLFELASLPSFALFSPSFSSSLLFPRFSILLAGHRFLVFD
jgi:hypothetical protein